MGTQNENHRSRQRGCGVEREVRLNPTKQQLIKDKIIVAEQGGKLADAIKGADIFIGVSNLGCSQQQMVRTMAPKSVIFAMANQRPRLCPTLHEPRCRSGGHWAKRLPQPGQ